MHVACHDQSEVWKLYCAVEFISVIKALRFATIEAEIWSQTPSLHIDVDGILTILTHVYHKLHCKYVATGDMVKCFIY